MSQPPKGQDPTQKKSPARQDISTLVTPNPPSLDKVFDLESLVGEVLLNYKITNRIAEGGMGVVYRAEHTSIGKAAAIKIIKAEYCQNETTMRRFLQEGRLVNQTRHPNIIDIFDFGSLPDGRAFYVMELLEGESLAKRVSRGRIPPPEALPMMVQAAEALQAAHAAGIIHRDLKPENLFIAKDEGRDKIKLLDFGIAKLVGMEDIQDKLTKTGNIIGTPHYMSPEQVNGANIDARSDIYSLGMVFYEMLSGLVPFGQRPVGQILAAQILGDTGEITTNLHSLTIPEGFKSLVKKSIATAPENRYQSMGELLRDLEALSAGKEIAAPKPVKQPAKEPPKLVLLWMGAAFLLILGLGVGSWLFSRPEPSKQIAATQILEEISIDRLRSTSLAILREQLRAQGPSIRASAAKALGDINDTDSRPRLEALLGATEDIEVRANAAMALASIGEKSAANALKNARKDASSYAATAMDAALFALGSERLDILNPALKGSPEEINIAAKTIAEYAPAKEASAALEFLDISSLKPLEQFELLAQKSRLGDEKSKEALQQKLSSTEKAEQILAAYAFAKVGSDLGRDNLIKGLSTSQTELAILAASSLLYFGDNAGLSLLQDNLVAQTPLLRKKAAEGLALAQDEGLAESLAPLLKDQDPQVQIAAAAAILSIVGLGESWLEKQSFAWAEQATTSDNIKARARGLLALGRVPAERSLPTLLKAFPDPEKSVNIAIINAVSRIALEQNNEKAKEFLLSLQKDSSLRIAGLVGLSKIDAKAKEEIASLLADTSPKTNEERAEVVAISAEQDNLDALLAALRDKVFAIKFEAAIALAKRGDASGLSILQEGAKSNDALSKTLAIVALSQLGQSVPAINAADLLDSKETRERLAGVELASLSADKKRKELLQKAWRDKEPEVRIKAIEAAAKAGDLSLAKKALQDKDLSVRNAAALLLQPPAQPSSTPSEPQTSPQVTNEATATCGNSLVEEGELCDDGNTSSGDGCKEDCKKIEKCGDGVEQSALSEECDDGNNKNEDGCSELCKEEGVSMPDRIRKANEAMLQAKAAFETGSFTKARGLFKKADELYKQGDIQWWYAQCDRSSASGISDKAARNKLLKRALDGYKKFAKAKPGDSRAAKANAYIKEIQERLQE